MKLFIVENYDEMTKLTYDIIEKVVKSKENPVISMTTGGTPEGLFEMMVNEDNKDNLDLSNTVVMNLDEYIGPKDAPYSVNRYMNERLYNKLKKQPKEKLLINGDPDKIEESIEEYKKLLDQNKRDIQILGLGTNGHIGANEPGTKFDSSIFLAHHEDSTIESTMKQYNIERSEAPDKMITLGFKEILEAEQVILMASGKSKAEAISKTIKGEITEEVPASYLKDKDNVIIIIDQEAASLLF